MQRLWITLFLSLIFALPSANARELRGDWETAGYPMQPTPPPYEFEYSCHAEVTDQQDRVGDGKEVARGRPYRLYATAKFSLTKKNSYWSDAKEWKWIAKRLDIREPSRDLKVLRQPPEGAFTPSTSTVAVQIRHVDGKLEDIVSLSAMAVLPHGSYRLYQRGEEERPRAEERITLRVTANLSRAEGEPRSLPRFLAQSIFVDCEKVK